MTALAVPAGPSLSAVGSADLFEYPIPTSERLETHSFVAFHHRRWRDSTFRNLADREVRAVGLDLFCVAQDQAPVGTLPTDPRLLAKLVGESLEDWQRLAGRDIPPLYNWRRCLTDLGEIRLYHPVVLEVVEAALGRRMQHLEKREADAERKRMSALPGHIIRAGGSTRMAQDEAYVTRLDQWLVEHHPGRQRRIPLVREAMEAMDAEGGAP